MPEPPPKNDRSEFANALTAATAPMGLQPDVAQESAMWSHFERMIEANRRFNLTRITTPADAAARHYADSLSLLAVSGIERGRPLAVLDVGTGAGFPAIPLAVCCPAWRVTAIDGTAKKVRFVAECAEGLKLANLVARHARAADLVASMPSRFDLVLLRAVTKVNPGLVEVQPLVKPGGRIVFYKTATMEHEELAAGRNQAAFLRLNMLDPFDLDIPAPDGPLHRRFIICERPK